MKIEKTFVIRNKYSGKKIFAFKCMSFRLCVEIAVSLKIDLSRTNLSWANLSGANLSGANLSGAHLYGSDLSRADLSRADLSGANIFLADLSGANLDNSCLPLCCGSLKANFDDKQIKQFLYHVLSGVKNSNNVSEELKRSLLTTDLLTIANEFHRIECERI